jgi:hypothetical protein
LKAGPFLVGTFGPARGYIVVIACAAMRSWAGKFTICAVLVLVAFLPTSAAAQTGPTGTGPTGPTASDPCSWEWGGGVEVDPEPCPSTDPDSLQELTEATVLGLGILVFLSACGLVYSWRYRGRS